MLFFILCGGLIELIQPYVNRHGEWLDMLANTSGVILGALLAHLADGFYKNEK
jgi:VanZ family protein